MKKLLAVLLITTLLLCAPTAGEDLYIVHTNDVHGHLADNLGYAASAGVIDDLRQKGAVILLDAGDALHGTQEAIEYQGASVVEIMNLMDYDAMALGNHEFDYMIDTLREREAEMEFPLLSANALYENGTSAFQEHIIIDRGGYTVGIFGLTTPSAASSPLYKRDLLFSFAADEELFAIAQNQVDELTAAGCDLIICVCHLGLDAPDRPSTSDILAETVDGIDLIVDGHSHTVLEEGLRVSDTLIVSTGSYLTNLGVVTVSEDKTLTAELVSSSDKTNPEVEELVNFYVNETQNLYSKEIGVSEVFLDGNRFPGVRNQETNLGDLCTDALLYTVQDKGFPADASIVNGGGIRVSLEAGTLTRYDLLAVMPFNNQITVIEVPGGILLQAIEDNTFSSPGDSGGGFPQVSGIRYTIDPAKPYVQGEVNRVSIQEVGGKPFDAEKTYKLAVSEYIALGGNNSAVFAPYYSGETIGILDSEVLEYYVINALNGTIGKEYENADSRIIYGSTPASPIPVFGILAGLAAALLLTRRS